LKVLIGVLAGALLLAAAGCGESESEKAREAAGGRGPITCEGTATSKSTGLPAGFPQPSGVTYVKAAQNGPTVVVNGFGTDDLDATFDAYKSGFESAGYAVKGTDHEEDDAEIEYAAKDGSGGQVALRAGESCDNGNTSVYVTNRPGEQD
jgi:hypothetical protein